MEYSIVFALIILAVVAVMWFVIEYLVDDSTYIAPDESDTEVLIRTKAEIARAASKRVKDAKRRARQRRAAK